MHKAPVEVELASPSTYTPIEVELTKLFPTVMTPLTFPQQHHVRIAVGPHPGQHPGIARLFHIASMM